MRSERDRLSDMLVALKRCQHYRTYLDSGDSSVAEMALDATLRNLAVVGEAAKALPEQTRAQFKAVPWHSIAGLRNIVVHEYFRIESAVILDIIDTEVKPLADLIRDYLAASPGEAER